MLFTLWCCFPLPKMSSHLFYLTLLNIWFNFKMLWRNDWIHWSNHKSNKSLDSERKKQNENEWEASFKGLMGRKRQIECEQKKQEWHKILIQDLRRKEANCVFWGPLATVHGWHSCEGLHLLEDSLCEAPSVSWASQGPVQLVKLR
jgi:hypothetical protein